MVTAQDILQLMQGGEGNRLEMKRCKDTVPESVWETYSAFANTRGGVILLGVSEIKDAPDGERFVVSGVEDANKVVTDFFNMINNQQKVSQSVLVDSDVRIVEVEGKNVIHIRVPEADYRRKPIYLKGDIKNGTYRRVHEGDRRASQAELGMMLRDSSEEVDMEIIEHYGMDDVDTETLRKYRQAFRDHNYGHTFEELSDKDFLIKMSGYRVDRKSGTEGLTMAGLLMFGKSLPIHENFPNFRVDYLDLMGIAPGDSKKWNDRLTDDGRWEDNLYNFLTLAMRKLLFTLPSEGKLHGVHRVDGGPMHEAVREAMVNAITYCDYRLGGVLRIDRKTDRIVLRNPGSLRISPERIYNGDFTQARNGAIQKMLRMLGYGDNIGSGFHKIMTAWRNLGYPQPEIHEEAEVFEVWLTLPVPTDPANVTNVTNAGGKDVTNDGGNGGKDGGIYADTIAAISRIPEITIAELATELSVSLRSMERVIKKLKDQGRIAREGSTRVGKWVVLDKPEMTPIP